MEPNKEYSKFGRQVGYIIGAEIALTLLGLISFPLLTKGLGATLYGTWSLIGAAIGLIAPFALLGLTEATIRFLAAEKDKGKISRDFLTVGCVIFITALILSGLLFLFSDRLAEFILHDVSLSFYIKLGSILILLQCIDSITIAYFRTFRQIGLRTTINLARRFFYVGLLALVILLGYKLLGVVAANIVSYILLAFTSLFIIRRQIGFQRPQFSHIKPYLRFGLPLTLNPAIMWIIHASDRYMVSYFIGVTATGIYGAAYEIGNYAWFCLGAVRAVLLPTIIKSYDEGRLGEARDYMRYSLKYFMMIAIPSAFGLSILAKPILQILATPEFVPGSTLVPLIAFGTVLFGVFNLCIYIVYLVKKTKLMTMLLGISAALNITFNIILIPRMGIMGAAVATLITFGVLGLLTVIVTRRYIKFDLSIPFMLKSVFSSAIMTLYIWLISPESIAFTIISMIGGALIYFAVLWLIKGLSKEEVTFFINFAKDNIKRIIRIKM